MLVSQTEEPPQELRFRRRLSPAVAIREFIASREVILTLTERELRVRYKQTILGFTWSIIIPVFLMIVFSVFLQRAVHVDTRGVPYPVFAFVGLIPWTFFSVAVNQGGQSIVNNSSLLGKTRLPGEVFPVATLLVAMFDAFISILVLGLLFVIVGFAPKATTFYVPLLFLIQLVFTLAVTLFVASAIVYVRDLRQAVPLLLQLGLFATPVAYPIVLSPLNERIYAALNPLGPIIEGYRAAVLFGEAPAWDLTAIAAVSAVIWMLVSYPLFKRLETGFADVA